MDNLCASGWWLVYLPPEKYESQLENHGGKPQENHRKMVVSHGIMNGIYPPVMTNSLL